MLWMYMTPNEIYFWKQCMSFIKTKIAKPSVHCSPVWGGLRSRWRPSSWRCRSRPGSGWPRRTSSARQRVAPAGKKRFMIWDSIPYFDQSIPAGCGSASRWRPSRCPRCPGQLGPRRSVDKVGINVSIKKAPFHRNPNQLHLTVKSWLTTHLLSPRFVG